MTDKKDKKFNILLLLGGGYGEKSYSRFLYIWINNTVIYVESKLILKTQGKTLEWG